MEVIKFGIGLTDLCKDAAGSDNDVRPKPEHRTDFREKIDRIQPTFLAFTSLQAGKRYFGRKVQFGLQLDRIKGTLMYVLPSTSPMAAWNWEVNKSHWHEFARLVHSTGVKGA
jgi:TDG/mug DNA glycosylase family protein